ncbi:MAG: homocysteine S-methyltransferase family protein [Geminicoccaceae bacterium]
MADLSTTLLEHPVLLADGGMGTGLLRRGSPRATAPSSGTSSIPRRSRPCIAASSQRSSDIILTNSFGGNRHRLKLHELQDRVGELNRAAAAVARSATAGAGRAVVVAGSIGPTGELIQPLGQLAYADAVAAFAEQAQALAEGGVDLLWIETMSAAEEVAAAVEGAMATGLPVVTTLSFDTNGRTMMGITPEAAVTLFHGLPRRPLAFGANCGTGPGQLLATVLALKAAGEAGDVLVAKGNCSIPEYRHGHIHYSGTPAIIGDYARLARACGRASWAAAAAPRPSTWPPCAWRWTSPRPGRCPSSPRSRPRWGR